MERNEREPPDTCPSGARLLPPVLPPAPPGGGFGRRPRPDGEPNGDDLFQALTDGLNDIAVIRTTFETIEVFPEDQELRAELMPLVEDARRNLARRLESLHSMLESGRSGFRNTDLEVVRAELLSLLIDGRPRSLFEAWTRVGTFVRDRLLQPPADPKRNTSFRYVLRQPLPVTDLSVLPARKLVELVVDDLRLWVEDASSFTSGVDFDERVFNRYAAVLCASLLATYPFAPR